MTQIAQEDNELKRLLSNPAKNVSEDGSMAPPLSVGYLKYVWLYVRFLK